MSKNLLFIILIIMVMGCAHYGTKYDTSAINKMELWKTTESDVISMVGEPISKNRLSDEITIYEYKYAKSGPFGNYLNIMQVQFFNGFAMNKSQVLTQY